VGKGKGRTRTPVTSILVTLSNYDGCTVREGPGALGVALNPSKV
jgi:hypothetical protein